MKKTILLTTSAAILALGSAQSAVLLTSNFGNGTDKTLVAGTGVTITLGLSLVGLNEQSENGHVRIQSGIDDGSFTTGTDYVEFGIKTTNASEQFSLNTATALISFDNDRVFGDNPAQRIVVFAGSDSTGTVLYTSPETVADTDNTHSGPFPAIVGSEFYFQIQYRNDTDNGSSGATRLDNVNIQGDIVPIPEPTTWSALLGAVGMLTLVRRRK